MSPISETLCPNETESSQQPHIELRVVVFTLRDGRLHILLQPSDPPSSRSLEFPAFPILPGQALEQTAENCLREIMHVHEIYLEQLYTYGGPQRHPAQALVSVVYFSLIPLDRHPLRSQPSALAWMPVNTPPLLAMDHAGILAYALRRLRYKLEYTAVGFELLPETFSLSELQQTYEMILDEVLDKRNFRRRILQAGIIDPPKNYRSGEGRPARLYRYRQTPSPKSNQRLFP